MKAPWLFTIIALAYTASVGAAELTDTGFFYPIGKRGFQQGGGSWLGRDANNEPRSQAPHYYANFYHIGVDMITDDENHDVYAIADGKVYKRHCDDESWGRGNCALFVSHRTGSGEEFTALYGHLRTRLQAGDSVYGGKPIGKTGPWPDRVHLHFGIFWGTTPPSTIRNVRGWGRMANSEWNKTNPTNSFVSPIEFIETRSPHDTTTQVQAFCQGDICWKPIDVGCEYATLHYRVLNPPFAQRLNRDVCADLRAELGTIAAAENPHRAVPADHAWRKWWRGFLDFFGKVASASDIRQFGTINTISVLNDHVVAGNATLASHGAGMGYAPIAFAAEPVLLPDFITRKVWLETPWGVETYRYGRPEIVKMKAEFQNIGQGSARDSITVQFFLSRGYKEDRHNDWKLVGTDTIKRQNLRPGETHSETEGIELWRDVPSPGIWNIVACIDHPRASHNRGGEVDEEHESNNCSTEAVFEVTADGQVVNVPSHDLIVSSIAVASTQLPVPAGGLMGARMQIRNIGNAKPTTAIRSAYEVCGPLPDTTCRMIADDGSDADELLPGRDQGEEIKSLVAAPTTAGAYELCGVANYHRTVVETDYSNNRTCITFEVHRAAPDFVVAAIGLAGGKTSAKKGDKVTPAMVIANVGNADAPRGIRSAYYYSGPETGGAWRYIADDGSDASDLRAGRSVREEIKDGLKIKVSGTYYFRGCADYQQAVAEANEENNCTTSGPVSIR